MADYNARWPAGSRVRIADSSVLEKFAREWRYHNTLQPQQLEHAGQDARVKSVGYYHGGDPLYVLEDLPGVVWHECCLEDPHS
jgi:hypothetical protein